MKTKVEVDCRDKYSDETEFDKLIPHYKNKGYQVDKSIGYVWAVFDDEIKLKVGDQIILHGVRRVHDIYYNLEDYTIEYNTEEF